MPEPGGGGRQPRPRSVPSGSAEAEGAGGRCSGPPAAGLPAGSLGEAAGFSASVSPIWGSASRPTLGGRPEASAQPEPSAAPRVSAPAIGAMPGAHASGAPRDIVPLGTRRVGCRSAQPIASESAQGAGKAAQGSVAGGRCRGSHGLPVAQAAGGGWWARIRYCPAVPCPPCGAPRWAVCLGEGGFELGQPDFPVLGEPYQWQSRAPGNSCCSGALTRREVFSKWHRLGWALQAPSKAGVVVSAFERQLRLITRFQERCSVPVERGLAVKLVF